MIIFVIKKNTNNNLSFKAMTVKELKEALKDLDENYQLEILNQINGKELYLYSIVEDPYSNTVSIFLNEYVDL